MRYLSFADKADKDGFPNIARLFRAISWAEQIHATSHFMVLRGEKGPALTVAGSAFGLGSTAENLGAAIEGEEFEVNEMYPAYKNVTMTSARFASAPAVATRSPEMRLTDARSAERAKHHTGHSTKHHRISAYRNGTARQSSGRLPFFSKPPRPIAPQSEQNEAKEQSHYGKPLKHIAQDTPSLETSEKSESDPGDFEEGYRLPHYSFGLF